MVISGQNVEYLHQCRHYFFASNEQIRHDFSRSGNNIRKSWKPEYNTIRQNGTSRKYSSVFSVQGKQGSNIDSKRYQIIAVETITQNKYASVSPKRGKFVSGIFFFY